MSLLVRSLVLFGYTKIYKTRLFFVFIPPGKDPVYIMNGFFMSMRQNFVAPDASIYYFVVEWDSKDLSWEQFRGDVLGPADPITAPEDSMRGLFYKNWEAYGLTSVPNVGDNAVSSELLISDVILSSYTHQLMISDVVLV